MHEKALIKRPAFSATVIGIGLGVVLIVGALGLPMWVSMLVAFPVGWIVGRLS